MFKWITKKDLTYWIIFLIVISLLSSDIGQNNKLILDNWSFTSVVVSIILALLAIIYTFDQSSTTLFSTRKLEESADKIEVVSKELEKISVHELFSNLEGKIGELTQSVEVSIENKFNSQLDNIKNLVGPNEIVESPFETNEDLFTEDQWASFVKRYIEDNATFVGIAVVHLYIKFKYNLDYGYGEITAWIEKNAKEDSKKYASGIVRGAMNGITLVLQSLGVIGITKVKEFDKIPISHFSKGLGLEIEKLIGSNKESPFLIKIRKIIEENENEKVEEEIL